jgi:hypothetical protein
VIEGPVASSLVVVVLNVASAPHAIAAQDSESYATLVARFGEVDGAPEYTFGRVADMAFGPGENVYVLDNLNGEVRVFDLEGRFLHAFGRKGSGPGEMQFPTRIIVSSEHVRVLDPSLQRAIVFSRSGEHIETSMITEDLAAFDVLLPLRYGMWFGAKTSVTTGRAMMSLLQDTPSEFRDKRQAARAAVPQVVVIANPRSPPVDTLLKYDHGFVQYIEPRQSVGMFNRYWGAGGTWAVSGDSAVAVIDAFEGFLRIYKVTPNGLRIVRSGRIPITPRKLTESDWREVEAVARAEGQPLAPRLYLIGPAFQSQLGEALFADDGALWVRHLDYDPAGAKVASQTPVYLVVPVDGSAQARVRLPPGFSLRAVKGDLLLGLRRGEFDVDYVEIWRRQ